MAFPKFVFLGLIFGVSLAQSDEELWHSQNLCLSGWDFFVFLWPKVMKNHGVSEIHVFLHPEMLEFCVVGELPCWGHKLEIDVLNFVPFCYWKGAKFAGKIYIFWEILTCIIDALSKSFSCCGKGRKHTCT